MQTRNCLTCGKSITGPHNKKYCDSQDIKGSCAHKAGIVHMHRIYKEKRALKWKPCLLCGEMIEAKGSTKYCGNQRTPGTCSYRKMSELRDRGRNIKEPEIQNIEIKEYDPVVAITPRQERIQQTLRHNRNAAKLVVRKHA